MLTVMYKKPGEKVVKMKIKRGSLPFMQQLVDGFLEAYNFCIDDTDYVIYCNEEARLYDMKPCLDLIYNIFNVITLLGPVVITKVNSEGSEVDLTDEDVKNIEEYCEDFGL